MWANVVMWVAVQLFWLGVGLYTKNAWKSWWHQGKHRGEYQYAVRAPQEWPHGHHVKGRIA